MNAPRNPSRSATRSAASPARQPKGRPTGGQFAAKANPECETELSADQPVCTVRPTGTETWWLDGQRHRPDTRPGVLGHLVDGGDYEVAERAFDNPNLPDAARTVIILSRQVWHIIDNTHYEIRGGIT